MPISRLIATLAAVVAVTFLVMPTASASAASERPHALSASVISSGVLLEWKSPTADAGAVTGYQVLRRDRSSDAGLIVHVDDTQSTLTHYVNTDVEQGVSYNYRVKAIRSGALSGRSSWVRVTFVQNLGLVHGQSIEASLGSRSEADWYDVWLEEGRRYTFTAGGLVSGYTLDMPVITGLYDEAQVRIGPCRNYWGNTGLYNLDAKMRIVAPYTGKFWIKVHSAGFGKGTYSITMR